MRWRAVALAAVAMTSLVARDAVAAPATSLVAADAPDPDVLVAAGRQWLYTTNVFPFGFTLNVPVRVSDDLVTWAYVGDAMPEPGRWARAGRTWAPSVIEIPGGYALFYSARHNASGRQCIGRATSALPQGPFVDRWEAPLVCELDRGGSIDPDAFRAPDGRLILHWKSDGNAVGVPTVLWAQELTPDGAMFASGSTPRPLLSSAGGPGWEAGIIENPAMVTGSDGTTWLMYSGGEWQSPGYAVGIARCWGEFGPCERAGILIASGGGAVGPGGASPFVDRTGQLWLALHGWVGAASYSGGGERWTALATATADANGLRFQDVAPASPPLPLSRCAASTSDERANAVARLYYAYFQRPPDEAGAAYWAAKYGAGDVCLSDIAEYFASSHEFTTTYGSLDIPAFVRRVYLNVLGREPDPDGYTYWAHQVAGGLRRGSLMIGFSESPEFRAATRLP